LMTLDRYGRASFAVLALAILLLANLSIVFMLQVQREEMELANQANAVRAMREVGALVHREVEVAAHYIAMAAVRNATQDLNNQSRINELFSDSFYDFVEASFPREARGFTVSVEDFGVIIVTEAKSVTDVVRTGTLAEYNGGEDPPEAIETGEPGGLEEAQRISYYHLIGHVNYTISDEITTLTTSEDIASEIDSPFPFVNRQLQRFLITSQGPMSHAAQALRYMLTTVAQQRVLLGYAGGTYGRSGTGITSVLTPQDVEMAVNLVLVMEQIRLFRSVDRDSVDRFDEAYYLDYAGGVTSPKLTPSADNRTLLRLLETYAGNGTLDPADLLELFTALDREDLQMNRVLAQALYAMIDQFVLKYLDYFDFLPLEFIADLGLNVLELLTGALDQFIDWLTNHQREADMVREFVRDLFGDMAVSTSIMGPASLRLPDQTYTVTDGNGQEYNITLPSELYSIPFKSRPLLEGNNGIWSGYFTEVFKDGLKAVHAGVRDLAMDIADSLAQKSDMIGLFDPVRINGAIDPRDDTGVLEYIRGAINASLSKAMEGLRGKPKFYQGLVANLWVQEKGLLRGLMDYIEQKYDSLSDRSWNVIFARGSLIDSIIDVAASGGMYRLLDDTARAQLRERISQAVDANGWAQAAYEKAMNNDVVRFESLYERAVNLDTPPANGGMYQRMMEMISSTTGILTEAGEFVSMFMEGLTRNERISNDKILIPAYTQSFEFHNPGLTADRSQAGLKEEALVVDQCPDLLPITRLTRDGRGLQGEPDLGELWVDVVDPTDVPASGDSPNMHYTQIDRISDRPFETQWTIKVKGSVGMTVSTQRAVYLDPEGLVPVVDRIVAPLNLTIVVTTYSGWPLVGVDYANSNTFGGDLWAKIQSFFEQVWDAVSSTVGWLLDGAKFLLDQLSSIIDYLLAQASKVLKFVYDAIDYVLGLLQKALQGIISHLMDALDYVLKSLPRFEFKLSGFGLSLRVAVNCDQANRLLIEATIGPFNIIARFVNLENAGITPRQEWASWDVFADVNGAVGPFTLKARIDPLMIVNDRALRANATWGNEFALALVAPEVETYHAYGFCVEIPIPVPPIGEVEIELGFRVRASEQLEVIDIPGIIAHSYEVALEHCGGFPRSIDQLKACIEQFARHFVDDLLAAVKDLLTKIIDVTLYVKGTLVFEDVAGVGISLSLTVEREGLQELFAFIEDNIRGLLDCLFDRVCVVHMENAPRRIGEHIFVTLGVFMSVQAPTFVPLALPGGGSPEIAVTFCIAANLALLGRIVKLNLGTWEIDFGMVIEDLPASLSPDLFGTGVEKGDLWIFKGTLMPLQ
jgi:hypothetical protein